jgi:hypothetical protein
LNWFNFPIYNFGYGGGRQFRGQYDEVMVLSESAPAPQMKRGKSAPMDAMTDQEASNAMPASPAGLSSEEDANWNNTDYGFGAYARFKNRLNAKRNSYSKRINGYT